MRADNLTQGFSFDLMRYLAARQVDLVLAGGQIAQLN